MQLNPMHLKISTLLGGRLFRIPEYQRAYAWGKRQRVDLFNDILDVKRSGREHFMATLVTLAKDNRLIGADEYRTVEIVDGQQRVTTIVILLKAIEKNLDEQDSKQEKIRREIAELLVKDDDYSLILLQTNHDSSSVFADYIRKGEINFAEAKTAADLNVVDAARECEAFVREWSRDKTLIDLVATIRNQLSVIYHEISDEATVYRVFEVLNSRGLDVKWIDKLKSQLMALLFEHLEGGSRAEAVREMQVIWQDIYRILGLRGDLGDEALRFAGTLALSSRPNRIIGQEDAATELAKVAGTKAQTIAAVGSRLKAVVQAVNTLDQNVRLRAVTKIAHARFVATAILLRKFEPDVERRLLGTWERVTFRIFGLGGADTRHKVGDYVRLGYVIGTNGIDSEEIDANITEIGKEYKMDVIDDPKYWFNCYDGWTEEIRYLLFRYDEYLAASAGILFNSTEWNKIWADDAARSIEHIKPQSSGVAYVHHLGNLTMLPPKVNSMLQDKSPDVKAATYRNCGLIATRAVGEAIEMGTKWNEAAVRERTSRIEAFVRKEWGD
ncbi:DUF262 domain-containing protein [Labrys monachus]|uniref:DUF262 domain-containing protein n=1 Tax=Labrys monachus TaxID=217067 RepID=A0ABU0FCQ5_9HYPH|nr:DUF262 domain-containing HNH endonuclease family protein [Labrys monachus]MDQ0392396.1 hypothetical protein [Labrys monachus]